MVALKWKRLRARAGVLWAEGGGGRRYLVESDHGLFEPQAHGLEPGSAAAVLAGALNLVDSRQQAQEVCEALEHVARNQEALDRLTEFVAKVMEG